MGDKEQGAGGGNGAKKRGLGKDRGVGERERVPLLLQCERVGVPRGGQEYGRRREKGSRSLEEL